MKKTPSEKLIKFLDSHPLINRNALEKVCELPQSTLADARVKERGIPEAHVEKVTEVLKEYGYKK